MGEAIVFFIFIIGAIVVAILVASQQNLHLTEAYRHVAQRYGGRCEAGGLLTRPTVRFLHAGSAVTVDTCATGGENTTYYTQAHFQWPQPDFRCEVYPEGLWSRVHKLIGMEDIEIGSPDFDESYIITGNDRTALRNLLNAAVQLKINELRNCLDNNDIYVSFSRGTLLIKKKSLINRAGQLQEFVRLAIDLYDQAALTLEQGITFVPQSQPLKASEVVCQICGDPLTSDVVFCKRCKTPHHLDCWKYYGACSTYGCRETRYVAAKKRQSANPPAKDR